MFRRKKSQPETAAEAESSEDTAAEAAGAKVEGEPEAELRSEAPASPPPDPAQWEPEAQPTTPMPDDYHDDLSPRVWIESVLDNSPPPSFEERERQAARDFQAAIAPGLQGLREAVPDASSPEDARRILEERQGELIEDSEGASLSASDIYRNETSVYYRIRTHFDRPRRRVGWGGEWRPPADLARPVGGRRNRRELGPGDR